MAKSQEGRIADSDTDKAFHDELLGDDKLPPRALDELRASAARKVGERDAALLVVR